MTQKFSHGYALLIGVGQSVYSQWSLPVTVKDIQALRTVLIDPDHCAYPNNSDRIQLLHDEGATRTAILNRLKWLQEQTATDREATVLVYYSGHGWLDQTQNRYYLVQHDVKPFNLPESALAAENFTSALHQIRAKRLLVVIDCCHAQGMASAKAGTVNLELPKGFASSVPVKGVFDDLAKGEGRAVFTSCRETQKSWIRRDGSMSIYTYHLIEALKGAASQPGDRVVGVADLFKHLDRAVPKSAHQDYQAAQEPWFSGETENFPIALLRGGKGLQAGGQDTKEEQSTTTTYVHALGDRSVAIGSSISGSTIITGDSNM